MSDGLSSIPITLIALPYHCGIRGGVPGNGMANGPLVLIEKGGAARALGSRFSDSMLVVLDNADRATDAEHGGDPRTIPAGDQMGQILVQNMHLARAVRTARSGGRLPIVSAGTCSAAWGIIGGLGDEADEIGIVWFDAHGDAATPDNSYSGFIEGMILSTIAGKCWPRYRRRVPGFREVAEQNIVCVSVHESFSAMGRADASLAVGTVIYPPTIAALGYEKALRTAFELLATRVRKVYVHVDADVLDPSVLKANLHAADGGLTDVQISEGLALVAEYFEILAVGFASYDPDVDPRGPDVLVPLIVSAAESAARSLTKPSWSAAQPGHTSHKASGRGASGT